MPEAANGLVTVTPCHVKQAAILGQEKTAITFRCGGENDGVPKTKPVCWGELGSGENDKTSWCR